MTLSSDNVVIWTYGEVACFLAGALFRLNSSAIKAVENLAAGIDVLEGETEPIHKIISTKFDEDKKQIVCLEPHCLGEGKPSTQLCVTGDHMIRLPVSGIVVNADYLVGKVKGVKYVAAAGSHLYHVLLANGDWKFLSVSGGVMCESLCPFHPLALQYQQDLTQKLLEQKRNLNKSAQNLCFLSHSRDIGVVAV